MKKQLGYTTIEQSEKLIKAGLDPNTADMWLVALDWQETEYYVEVKQEGINQPKKAIPCWSIGTLIELMPKSLNWNSLIIIGNQIIYALIDQWTFNGNALHKEEENTLIESAIKTIVWLLEQGEIK